MGWFFTDVRQKIPGVEMIDYGFLVNDEMKLADNSENVMLAVSEFEKLSKFFAGREDAIRYGYGHDPEEIVLKGDFTTLKLYYGVKITEIRDDIEKRFISLLSYKDAFDEVSLDYVELSSGHLRLGVTARKGDVTFQIETYFNNNPSITAVIGSNEVNAIDRITFPPSSEKDVRDLIEETRRFFDNLQPFPSFVLSSLEIVKTLPDDVTVEINVESGDLLIHAGSNTIKLPRYVVETSISDKLPQLINAVRHLKNSKVTLNVVSFPGVREFELSDDDFHTLINALRRLPKGFTIDLSVRNDSILISTSEPAPVILRFIEDVSSAFDVYTQKSVSIVPEKHPPVSVKSGAIESSLRRLGVISLGDATTNRGSHAVVDEKDGRKMRLEIRIHSDRYLISSVEVFGHVVGFEAVDMATYDNRPFFLTPPILLPKSFLLNKVAEDVKPMVAVKLKRLI